MLNGVKSFQKPIECDLPNNHQVDIAAAGFFSSGKRPIDKGELDIVSQRCKGIAKKMENSSRFGKQRM